MNDEFDKRLSQIELNEPPPNLRAEVLQSIPTASGATERATPNIPWWKEFFWPCPQAWLGMASLWAIMIAIHFGTDPTEKKMARESDGIYPTTTIALLRRHELITDELLSQEIPEHKPKRKKKPAVDRPRSSRSNRTFRFA